MKIYYSNLASVKEKEFASYLPENLKIGVLISYYKLKKLKKPIYCDSLFLDSGAFSAFRQNITIQVVDYIRFLKGLENYPEVVAALDDIGSFKKTKNNFQKMVKAGVESIPCFHIGEPFELLEEYMEFPYVALGGIAFRPKQERAIWLDKVFNMYPNGQFHGFGIQDIDIILRYPWKSVDSSSAHMQARFGGIATPWGWLKINPNVNPKDLRWKTPIATGNVDEWFATLNMPFPLEEAQEATSTGTAKRVATSVIYFEKLIKNKKTTVFKPKSNGFGL